MRLVCAVVCVVCAGVSGVDSALSFSAAWGFHSVEDVSAFPDFATHTFDSDNLTAIDSNFKRHGVKALFPATWTQAKAQPCTSPITRMHGSTFTCLEVVPDLQQMWDKQFLMLKPYIASGAVVGVFVGDETVWRGLSFDDVARFVAMVRTSWPSALIYQNEAPDVIMCGFNKLNATVLQPTSCLPDVDLFSFDFYGGGSRSPYNSTWAAPRLAYEHMVVTRFTRASQHAIHVTTGYAQKSPTLNVTQFDHFCARNALEMLKWGLEDATVSGFFPFYYPSTSSMVGLSSLPNCWKTFQAIANVIRASGGATNTSAPRQSPKSTCGPAPPAPSDWWWCNRS